ncbi:hypothetical protein BDB00DRAFT_784875 [Zychaea mexicana]|uniref:uncharacterized protein n=1 Tax=Zychaea mexicana TaxID=64656 RepID=UPI0022FDB249|nr:uncharacterized protein BDB00DRAFT_784875 [Zychaea mexicana]KAI9497125.1 hypothetical protein BDB00DRAFT_784875 [Zychaea mexicana]
MCPLGRSLVPMLEKEADSITAYGFEAIKRLRTAIERLENAFESEKLALSAASYTIGISVAMRRLPLVAIKNKQTIGECELFTKYFDPILASLFSDPDRKVLLRWSNVMSD